jgi:hypothetical protein
MNYGMRIKDMSGNTCVLTPEIGTIISAGRITMPSGLVDTNKYYATVNLPATIPVANLSVLITPAKWTMRVFRDYSRGSSAYQLQSKVLDNAYSFYTKNLSTGVMTTHTAGDRTLGNPSKWHNVISAFPLCYWEILGATSVSDIKIFAATCYCTSITATTSGTPTVTPKDEFVYSIYTDGVEKVDYMIICKRFNY